jgi:hypothetical protein
MTLFQKFLTWFRCRPATVKKTGLIPLRGDGTWPWVAYIDGDDIVVKGAKATCFGGANDPQDSGETASGISTKKYPHLAACSLPMDGRMWPNLSAAERKALDGSPIPRLGDWPKRALDTVVEITSGGKTISVPVIDLGPGKRTGHAIDLTVAAARKFNPKATATNFKITCDFRIKGAAKFAPGGQVK